ncbi:MAG: PspC domain-containing protein [Rhodothermaceae bacterium]|nr:PspC domain-containing protein [Rhodothermaceae bacterium]
MGIAAISALRTKRTRRVRTVSSRHLVRPRKKRWLFGVCRGLANRFGIPVGVLRLLFPAVAVAAGGPAPGGLVIVALYVILALAIPSEETNRGASS